MKLLNFFLTITILLSLVSCSQQSKDEVVIKAGSVKLTKKELQEDIKTLPPQAKLFVSSGEGLERLRDELIKREVLYAEAKARNITNSEEFKRRLEDFKKITLINMLLEEEIKKVREVTEQEAKEYYEKNKEQFIRPTEIRLSQIVVKSEDDAKRVYERIDRGEEFSKIAEEISIDSKTKSLGGDIGFVKKGQLAPQIESAFLSLKKGDVSMPVKLNGRIHIFKVTDIKGNPIEFDKIKSELIEQLKSKRQQEWFSNYIEELKKRHKVEVNEKVLKETLAKAISDSGNNTQREK